MGKRIDVDTVPVLKGSSYPAPFDAPCAERARQRLSDAAGLTDGLGQRVRPAIHIRSGVNLRTPSSILPQPSVKASKR
jgi:hypothetical protein